MAGITNVNGTADEKVHQSVYRDQNGSVAEGIRDA